ncbi:M28 family peptidase [Cytophaga hutchinsonii]|uniref:Possible aminopeptidase n=1 Tax=Cytophaga hutchinsonii (strain ATCC 33406 / DSM 1761 / CIP 103989 / NBRC 15051 / NCIMB 9469 / D465) TaxID=269798 RepID=A0A6N4SPP7_CYTH3|nr:M28 family peptidase [Cytophaga hutchinsonii]ABG58297.1 possible aminopeptidase [Cytophaga hutchinsonii ATCC 33406]SFX53095.1 Peptidase family M28 [Cytophaga hutchinsonii ATCC 33406]
MTTFFRKYLLLQTFVFSGISALYAQPIPDMAKAQTAALNSITAADLSAYLHIVASDSMEGRATGEAGQKRTALYLADKFKEFGLSPAVPTAVDKSYFQKFSLVEKTWKEVWLKVGNKQKEFLKDFYAYGDVQLPEATAMKIVCAGYGIEARNYSDYTNLDVKDKGVIIFTGEPFKDSVSLVTKTKQSSTWANDWRAKADLAYKKGAKAVFIIVGNTDTDFETRLAALKDHLNAPSMAFTHKKKASAFFVPASLAAEMLKSTPDALASYKKNRTGTNTPYPFKSAKVIAKAGVTERTVETENVLAVIEGSRYPEEIVVLTAHYDHLGIENGQICYGADDDGSGTVALLEIAQAFSIAKSLGHGPARTILFMPVTGEERGLMGSEYYTDKPVFPLKNTVADLNIDMIGRVDAAHPNVIDENYVYIIGDNRLSSELHTLSENANTGWQGPKIVLDYTYNSFDDPNRFYYRSDHYNFAKNNIPVIFYFSGIHADYHKPTDTVDKIRFDKMAKITQLVFLTAWQLANMDHRLVVDRTE